jgi:NOL1/NOP2/fmu family ribosome biogenesis protein
LDNVRGCTPETARYKQGGFEVRKGHFKKSKITNAVLQIFGKFATKNIIYIDEEQLKDYIMGKDVEVGEIEGVERGQVIVKFKGDVIGSGLYDGRVIKNQIPKARRIL